MSKRIISRLWLRSIFLFVVLLAILPLAMFMGCSSGGGENPVQEEAPVSEDTTLFVVYVSDLFSSYPCEQHNGEVAFVRSKDTWFKCVDGDWDFLEKPVGCHDANSFGFIITENALAEGGFNFQGNYYKTYKELTQCVPCDNRHHGHLYDYMGMHGDIPFGQETPIGDVKYRCVQSLVDGSYSWKRSDSISFFEYDWGYQSMISRDSALVAQNLRNLKHGTMTDSRDGQVYKTVTIGTQTWMAENLNYRYLGATFDRDSSSFCYNCAKYGRLYLLSAAVDSAGLIEGNVANGCGIGAERMLIETIRGVCPEGWHLPQIEEWDNLVGAITVHGEYTRGLSKLRSTSGWEEGTVNGNGDDSSSFSALPAGYLGASICKMGSSLCAGEYCCEGRDARFWSYGYGKAWVMRLTDNDPGGVVLLGNDHISGDAGYSVRCVKDEIPSILSSSSIASSSSVTYEMMTDSRDGKTYKIVTIGTQTWMAENLNYETAMGSFCNPNVEDFCDTFGRLYTWATAVGKTEDECGYGHSCTTLGEGDIRGVCPEGWHLPDSTEWKALFNAVGGNNIAGAKLKTISGWDYAGYGYSDDAFGFSALPAIPAYGASFWSSTERVRFEAHSAELYFESDDARLTSVDKGDRCSVRCVKD